MFNLKIGDKELNIKYGYEPTLKNRIISRVVKQERAISANKTNLEIVEDMLLFLPEFMLIGLQKFHYDEYGFNWNTGDGKDEQLSKVFELLDQYLDCDDGDANVITLFQSLEQEMLQDGFLKQLFRQEVAKSERKSRKATKTA